MKGASMDDYSLGPDRLRITSNAEIKLEVVKALDGLMLATDIDRISVKAICDSAGISRATFYRYFDDKYAIVQWYLEFLDTKGVDRIGRTLSWYEGYFLTTALIHENLQFFENAARSSDRNSLNRIAPHIRRDTLIKTITDCRHAELTEHLRFQVNAVAHIETVLFPAWHFGKYSCSLEDICHWMVECVPRELFELLNTPLTPQRATRPKA